MADERNSSRSQPSADAQERSHETPHSGGGTGAPAFAIQINGDLDIRTVCPSERGAKINWLVAGEANRQRVIILASDSDEFVEAAWSDTAEPQGAHLVPVVVTAADEDGGTPGDSGRTL